MAEGRAPQNPPRDFLDLSNIAKNRARWCQHDILRLEQSMPFDPAHHTHDTFASILDAADVRNVMLGDSKRVDMVVVLDSHFLPPLARTNHPRQHFHNWSRNYTSENLALTTGCTDGTHPCEHRSVDSRRRLHVFVDGPDRDAERNDCDDRDHAYADSNPAERRHIWQLALAINFFVWAYIIHLTGAWGYVTSEFWTHTIK